MVASLQAFFTVYTLVEWRDHMAPFPTAQIPKH